MPTFVAEHMLWPLLTLSPHIWRLRRSWWITLTSYLLWSPSDSLLPIPILNLQAMPAGEAEGLNVDLHPASCPHSFRSNLLVSCPALQQNLFSSLPFSHVPISCGSHRSFSPHLPPPSHCFILAPTSIWHYLLTHRLPLPQKQVG